LLIIIIVVMQTLRRVLPAVDSQLHEPLFNLALCPLFSSLHSRTLRLAHVSPVPSQQQDSDICGTTDAAYHTG